MSYAALAECHSQPKIRLGLGLGFRVRVRVWCENGLDPSYCDSRPTFGLVKWRNNEKQNMTPTSVLFIYFSTDSTQTHKEYKMTKQTSVGQYHAFCAH